MELKEYQQKVLENLGVFLRQLKSELTEKKDYYQFQLSKNKEAVDPEKSDYPQIAWARCKERIIIKSDYSARFDGLGRNIPSVCFKVPTGGGKTLLAAHALRQINQDYFEQNNGFILWVVPSQTIYKQTLKHLCNREHPYRQVLDQASGGRVKILEKNDAFKPQDVADNLCVMLLMLQSSNRETKESLRFFRDSGKFREFFPEVDDYIKNKNLLDQIKNLETADLLEGLSEAAAGLSIKHSLGNVLRLIRPIVLIDEGHKAVSPLAKETIGGFNPKFILELSATPKSGNILVDVKGAALKDEQMIKLPINLQAYPNSDWKSTLNQANQKLSQLSKDAALLENKDGRRIRPIMVIKAEPKKKNNDFDQAAEIKSYLMNNLAVREDEIRIKLSENDEIGDEDLLGRTCQVKYIITKDALKEGWDCSFAYVLAILSNTKSETALTQFIGRVLRQPDARTTSIKSLNECYVYCANSDVDEAAAGIKKGLEEKEGMGDLLDQIRTGNEAEGNGTKKVKLQRREKYREEKILLPTLNAVDKKGLRAFDYYRDILAEIDWANYNFSATILLNNDKEKSFIYRQIDVDEDGQTQMNFPKKFRFESDDKIDRSLMVSQLIEKINNPWQAARILDEALIGLRRIYDEKQISINSVFIAEEIKKDALRWFLKESESVFRNKLSSKKIFMRLVAFESDKFNWQMPSEVEINVGINEAPTNSFDNNIFEPQFTLVLNGFERKIASYINGREAVKWWHRLAVKGSEYAVSGWTKEKIYPDFLIAYSNESGKIKLQFVETKGDHLKDNDKTNYIKSLFKVLNSHLNEHFGNVGEVKLINEKDEVAFDLILQENQESDLIRIEKLATSNDKK